MAPSTDVAQALLHDDTIYISFVILVVLVSVPSLAGVATNILNIRVFHSMPMSDTVTFTFFTLAMSDLGTSLGLLGICVSQLFIVLERRVSLILPIQPVSLFIIVVNVTEVFRQV